jgi:hypothetical protein
LLLVDDAADVWLIYLVMLLYGALNIVIAPAQSALLAGLLPSTLLASANSVLRTVQESLRFVAPLAGAGLFAVFGGQAVVGLDMLTFLAAAGFVLSLRYDEPSPRADDRPAATSRLRHWTAGLVAWWCGWRRRTRVGGM